MTIAFGPENMITRLVYETANFATGGGTTTLGWYVTSVDPSAGENVAETVRDAWNARLKAATDSDITLVEVQWENADYSGSVAAGIAGTGSVTGPVPSACTLVSYHSIGKGPRNRGRSYLPGLVGEGSVDERGTLTGGIVASIQTNVNNFFADVIASPEVVAQAITQSSSPGQVTTPILPWPQVNTRVVQPIMATQRRRMRR